MHVWVSETRPRNQGAALTAWELAQRSVPHTVVVDNAAGHLLRSGLVDLVVVGADRVAANGDVANKIGTYLKALAARDSDVPFYVAAPTSSFDLARADGRGDPHRGARRQRGDEGLRPRRERAHGRRHDHPPDAPVRNWGFDVTPARLISGFITERGVIAAAPFAIAQLARRVTGDPDDVEARAAVVAAARRLEALGLNHGTSRQRRTAGGWRTARHAYRRGARARWGRAASWPSIGTAAPAAGQLAPTSEWRLHAAVLAARPDVGAVVHTHSPEATAFACLRPSAAGRPLRGRARRRVRGAVRALRHLRLGRAGEPTSSPRSARVMPASWPTTACSPSARRSTPRSRWRPTSSGWPACFGGRCRMAEPVVLPDDEIAKVGRLLRTYGQP